VEEEDEAEEGYDQINQELDEHGPTAREIEGSLRRNLWE